MGWWLSSGMSCLLWRHDVWAVVGCRALCRRGPIGTQAEGPRALLQIIDSNPRVSVPSSSDDPETHSEANYGVDVDGVVGGGASTEPRTKTPLNPYRSSTVQSSASRSLNGTTTVFCPGISNE